MTQDEKIMKNLEMKCYLREDINALRRHVVGNNIMKPEYHASNALYHLGRYIIESIMETFHSEEDNSDLVELYELYKSLRDKMFDKATNTHSDNFTDLEVIMATVAESKEELNTFLGNVPEENKKESSIALLGYSVASALSNPEEIDILTLSAAYINAYKNGAFEY